MHNKQNIAGIAISKNNIALCIVPLSWDLAWTKVQNSIFAWKSGDIASIELAARRILRQIRPIEVDSIWVVPYSGSTIGELAGVLKLMLWEDGHEIGPIEPSHCISDKELGKRLATADTPIWWETDMRKAFSAANYGLWYSGENYLQL